MAGTERDDPDLTAFFAAARDRAPQPDPGLLARVMEDALATQAGLAQPSAQAAIGARLSRRALPRWRQLVALLGGWPALGGLALAGCAGLWIGISPPAALTGLPLADLGRSGMTWTTAEELADFFPADMLELAVLEEG